MLAPSPVSEREALAVATTEIQKPARKRSRTSLFAKFVFAFFGLGLFAALGYLAGTFFIAMHIKLPWYFPH